MAGAKPLAPYFIESATSYLWAWSLCDVGRFCAPQTRNLRIFVSLPDGHGCRTWTAVMPTTIIFFPKSKFCIFSIQSVTTGVTMDTERFLWYVHLNVN